MYPYNQQFSFQPQNYQPNFNPQIQSQVIKVRGEHSARSINLAPNSSILLMDETAPIVWLCTTDGVGTVTATPYDISLHQDAPPVDVGNLEKRIATIESVVAEMEARREPYGKSNKRHNSYDVAKDKADIRNVKVHAEPTGNARPDDEE